MNYNFALDFAGASSSSVLKWAPRMMAHGLWTTLEGEVTASSIAYGFTLAFVPSIALGVIVPIIAKVMTWYGLQPGRHQ
jgi:hypothetical protein